MIISIVDPLGPIIEGDILIAGGTFLYPRAWTIIMVSCYNYGVTWESFKLGECPIPIFYYGTLDSVSCLVPGG